MVTMKNKAEIAKCSIFYFASVALFALLMGCVFWPATYAMLVGPDGHNFKLAVLVSAGSIFPAYESFRAVIDARERLGEQIRIALFEDFDPKNGGSNDGG